MVARLPHSLEQSVNHRLEQGADFRVRISREGSSPIVQIIDSRGIEHVLVIVSPEDTVCLVVPLPEVLHEGDLDKPPLDFAFYDCFARLVGTLSVIKVAPKDSPILWIRPDGKGWETVDVNPELLAVVDRGIDDAVEVLAENLDYDPWPDRAGSR